MRKLAEQISTLIRSILDFFYPPFKSFLTQETYRYASTGGANLVLDIILYYLFYHYVVNESIIYIGDFIAISGHIAALILVFPITFSSGFFLAKYVTFTESKLESTKQLWRYGLSVLGSLIINYLLLKLFVEIFEFYPTPSKILSSFIGVAYSFVIQKFFTFKTGKKQLLKD